MSTEMSQAQPEPEFNPSADFASFNPFEDRSSEQEPDPSAASASRDATEDAAAARAETVEGQEPQPVRGADSASGSKPPESQGEGREAIDARDRTSRQRDGVLAELREEREERRRLAAENAEMLQFVRQLVDKTSAPASPAGGAPKPAAIPDPLVDPQAYTNYVLEAARAEIAKVESASVETAARTKFDTSRAIAEQVHGGEVASKAIEWVKANNAGTYFTSLPDPVGAAITEYRKAQALQTYGDDPKSYEQKVQSAAEARVMDRLAQAGVVIPDHLRAPAASGASGAAPAARQAAPAVRVPPSLANAPKGGATGAETHGTFSEFASSFLN